MSGGFLTAATVASYNAAFRINQLIDIPSFAASEILFPKVSRASVEEGPAKVKYLYERMVAILLSFTVPIALFIIIFPKFVITLIAGSSYKDAAPILQIYMITGILRPMQNQAANLLNSIGKTALCFVLNAVSLAANLLINYLCLKNIGFYGPAIGTLITCILGTTAWYLVIRKQIGLEFSNLIRYMMDVYKLIYNKTAGFLARNKQPDLPPE